MGTDETAVDQIDGIAAVIRRYSNRVDADTLAAVIARRLDEGGQRCAGCAEIVAGIIRRVNPDHTMGAERLAEAIYNDLNA